MVKDAAEPTVKLQLAPPADRAEAARTVLESLKPALAALRWSEVRAIEGKDAGPRTNMWTVLLLDAAMNGAATKSRDRAAALKLLWMKYNGPTEKTLSREALHVVLQDHAAAKLMLFESNRDAYEEQLNVLASSGKEGKEFARRAAAQRAADSALLSAQASGDVSHLLVEQAFWKLNGMNGKDSVGEAEFCGNAQRTFLSEADIVIEPLPYVELLQRVAGR